MSCGGKQTVHKIDLKNFPLEPVILQLNKSVLKFSIEDGTFKQTENKSENYKKKSNSPYYSAEIENSKLNINRYNETIKKLKDGINDVEVKKEKLLEMLKCDLAEKEYLEELKKAIGDYRQTIDDIKEIQDRTQSIINEKSIHTEYVDDINDNNNSQHNLAMAEMKKNQEEPEAYNDVDFNNNNSKLVEDNIDEVHEEPNEAIEINSIKEENISSKDNKSNLQHNAIKSNLKKEEDNEFMIESTEENLIHNNKHNNNDNVETFEV
jgi:hypothetical protein